MSVVKKKNRIVGLISLLLLQGCSGGGGSASSNTTISVNPLAAIECAAGASSDYTNYLVCTADQTDSTVLVSGTVTFDRVHHATGAAGLDYTNITQDPLRGATIAGVYTAGGLSETFYTTTTASGYYEICLPANSDRAIRANAEMYRTGAPSWHFTVVDNTQGQALYTMQTTSFTTGLLDITGKNLNASSGWGVSSYTGTRTAAPFAILDSIYDAFNAVLPDCSGAQFPALKINWSENNVAVEGNPAIGNITTTAFDGTQIYVLGAEDSDTDEYDGHVIVHEWAHYFEHNFSRSDSIGGPHATDDVLDIRVAFSEGFSNAYSAIATNDTDYNDSNGNNQSSGFDFNLEDNCINNKGWYSECSVQSIVYDLYDSVSDANDTVSLGFSPLFDVLINEQRFTPALTSIFSFVHEIKQNNSPVSAAIDTLVSNQVIDSITDVYGDSELTNNPGTVDQLPVYETIGLGQVVNVCSTGEHQNYNGLGVSRFLRFNLDAGRAIRITASRTSGLPYADPDIVLHYKGERVAAAESDTPNSETLTGTLSTAGIYIIEVYEYAYLFSGTGTTCFNVQLGSL